MMLHTPLIAMCLLLAGAPAFAIDSSLTYQGSLSDAGNPASGSYDLRFTLRDGAGLGIGAPLLRDNVVVAAGSFTVELDFGATAFDGADRQLGVEVRPGTSTGAYTLLTPDARITPVPYAQVSATAEFAATVATNSVVASSIVDGQIGSADIENGSIGAVDLDTAQVQRRIGATCAAGSAIAAVGVDGTVTCQAGLTGPEGPMGPRGETGATGTPGSQDAWGRAGNQFAEVGSFFGISNPNSAMPLVFKAQNTAIATFSPHYHSGYGDAPTIELGATSNFASAIGSTIAGGGSSLNGGGGACATCRNLADAIFATVSGGQSNSAQGEFSVVAGGQRNDAFGTHAAVQGGFQNEAADFGAVSGGSFNHALGDGSSVAGGGLNTASASYAAIAGGSDNLASGEYAIVAGGSGSCAGGDWSFAAGYGAMVRHGNEASDYPCAAPASGDANGDEGSFVWADRQGGGLSSTGPNQFVIRAGGGVSINAPPANGRIELSITSDLEDDYPNLWLRQRAASGPGMLVSVGDATGANNAGFFVDHYNGSAQSRRFALYPDGRAFVGSSASDPNVGALLAAGSGTWNATSDRRLKTAVAAIDPAAILDRVVAMPVSTWSYIAQGEDVRHIGPMAQDFAAAFGVGENDTTISTVDADGVALAAIQGLNAKLERENADLRQRLERETAALRRQLDAVLTRLSQLEAMD